jgi:alkaline phosphatase D
MAILKRADSHEAINPDPIYSQRGKERIGRRRVLRGLTGAAPLIVAPALLKAVRAEAANSADGMFSLGVASGDPDAHSVLLWTRLAPDPLSGGGLGNRPVPVRWEVATDPGMAHVLRDGGALARPDHGHVVQVLASGLPADQWLYYRFHAMGESSRVGRTRTFPPRGAEVARLRCAVVSCQNFTQGFYPAYRDLVAQDIDFVVHTGDYIYEGGPISTPLVPDRNHRDGEAFSVEAYRNRYALYRLDANLQEAHARFPFLVTWDDTEVDGNYAGTIANEDAPVTGADFLERRRNAYRVYSEMMPLRPENRLHGKKMRLYRKLEFGQLADIFLLDTRQFRTDQPAEDDFGSTDPDSANPLLEAAFGEVIFDAQGIEDPAATMMGMQQEAWLRGCLKRSQARWTVLAQQVMLTQWNLVKSARLTVQSDPSIPADQKMLLLRALRAVDNVYNVDAWDGYPAARRRLFQMIAKARPGNPVVLSGDIHAAWGANLLADFASPSSDMLAAEFVCTSISSTFLQQDPRPVDAIVRPGVVADNPHVEFFNALFRGYCLCDVDAKRWQTTYRAVGSLADLQNPSPLALTPFEDSPVETDAVLEIESGFSQPGSDKRLKTTFSRIPLA